MISLWSSFWEADAKLFISKRDRSGMRLIKFYQNKTSLKLTRATHNFSPFIPKDFVDVHLNLSNEIEILQKQPCHTYT